MKTDVKHRREPGFSLLANLLHKDARTIRRWISDWPELRRVLHARRHGKQWRIDYPKDQLKFDDWLEEVREAVSTFARTSEPRSEFVKDCLEYLGFAGDESECKQREHEVEILRHGLILKHASRKLLTPEADNEVQAENDSPTLSEWEAEAMYYCATARSIAGRFKCSIAEVPKYWEEFCLQEREENRAFNIPRMNWLKAHGLYERVMFLLPRGWGDLIAFIGATYAEGKPRIKLYRLPSRQKSNKEVRWRKVIFRTEHIQLLRVVTDEEIAAEASRMKELWPDPEHWKRASQRYQRDWQLRSLGEAALELMQGGKPVNGSNLARLLFRNRRTQDVWESHQQHLELKGQGLRAFCDEETYCKQAKRGVSLREFRQRYTKRDIAEATNYAAAALTAAIESVRNEEAVYGAEPTENLKLDPREKKGPGVGVRDEHGEAVTNATEKDKDFVTPATAVRLRRDFERADFTNLTPQQREAIETVLGCSLEAYIRKPFKEEIKPA